MSMMLVEIQDSVIEKRDDMGDDNCHLTMPWCIYVDRRVLYYSNTRVLLLYCI